MLIKIHVTKEIYRKAMYCGADLADKPINQNCAVALAVREIAPEARVGHASISWTGSSSDCIPEVSLPTFVRNMIHAFDYLAFRPVERLYLPEFSFEVDFPNELVHKIGIEEVKGILSKSETLEMA